MNLATVKSQALKCLALANYLRQDKTAAAAAVAVTTTKSKAVVGFEDKGLSLAREWMALSLTELRSS